MDKAGRAVVLSLSYTEKASGSVTLSFHGHCPPDPSLPHAKAQAQINSFRNNHQLSPEPPKRELTLVMIRTYRLPKEFDKNTVQKGQPTNDH